MAGRATSDQYRFDVIGVDLNTPPDALGHGRYPIVSNMRPEISGAVSPRPGTGNGTAVNGALSLHSVKRLNDSSSGTTNSIEILGAGTTLNTLHTDLTTPAQIDTGYSGNPLAFVIAQPAESVRPFVYVQDSKKSSKIDVTGGVKPIGLLPPAVAPSAALGQPVFKVVEEFDAVGTWVVDGGIATTLVTATRVDPAVNSVTKILYDSGSSGWACVQPVNTKNINEGMRLKIDAAGSPEIFTVKRLFRNSQATSIASILYEHLTALPGYVWLHLTTPIEEVDVDSFASIGGANPEYVRVQAVERTQDGHISLRVYATLAHLAGDSIQIVASFRAYFTATHANGNTLGDTNLGFTITGAGTGKLFNTGGSATIDLSAIGTGLPVRPSDYMHIDLFVSDPSLVSEIKLYMNIDAIVTSPATDADWIRNSFVHILRSNDFTPVTKGTQTLINNTQTSRQRDLLNLLTPTDVTPVETPPEFDPSVNTEPAPPRIRAVGTTPPGQINAGQSQWVSVLFNISELYLQDSGRIGSDVSRGLANVSGLKLEVIATGTLLVGVDNWWIGGGYGPDVGFDRGLIYRYRALDSTTGVRSNWSPAMRGSVSPNSEQVIVQAASQAAPCDKLEWIRLGGPTTGWHFVGNSPNSAPYQFIDTYADSDILWADSLVEGDVHYPLWPVVGLPISGTTAASGCLIDLDGSTITNGDLLAQGNAIQVGGKDYTIQQVRDANTALHTCAKIELVSSAGSLAAGTPWRIAAPIYLNAAPPAGAAATGGTPLPVFVGPFRTLYLGAGDPYNPQRLYYANGNDPDTTQDIQYLDIGNASEAIQNILLFEDRCMLWTTERTYMVEQAFTLAQQGAGLLVAREIPNSIGLWSRWAFCAAGTAAAFLARDGVYETASGGTNRLTEDLRLLFPHEGNVGVGSNGFIPPNMVAGNEAKFQLGFIDHELFFDYIGTDGVYHTIVRRTTPAKSLAAMYQIEVGWRPYDYATPIRKHYAEEGVSTHSALALGSGGKIFKLGRLSADDASAPIVWDIRTPSYTGIKDEQRVRKYYMDAVFNYDTQGDTFTITPGFDNHSVTLAPTTISDATGRKTSPPIDFNTGQGQRASNISFEIAGSSTTNRPVLYWWQFSLSLRPETSALRGLDYELVRENSGGVVLLRGLWIYADTAGVSRSALLEYTRDDGTIASITIPGINHATLTERYYPISRIAGYATDGIYMIAARVRPIDSNFWDFVGTRPDGDPAPPLSTEPPSWQNPEGANAIGARWVQGAIYDIDTQGVNVNMAVRVDGDALQTTVQAGGNSGPLNCTGRSQLPISFDQPFITHLIRSVPAAPCRVWAVKYISEPEPEMAYMWWTQQTDHGWTVHRIYERGLKGYQLVWGGYLTVRSTDNIKYDIIIDGVTVPAVFADAVTNTGGNRRKLRFLLPACKGKIFQHKIYAATTAGRLALYKNDCELLVKSWGSEEALQGVDPFGDVHFESGARI